jgi:hypothetical protein
VDNVSLVGVVEGLGGLDHDLPGFLGIEPALADDVLVQIGAVDEFKSQVKGAAVFAEAIDGDDVLMAQLGGAARLAAKALEHVGPGGEIGRQDLQGHRLLRLDIDGPINRPHAAGANGRPVHFILADPQRPSAFARRFRSHATCTSLKGKGTPSPGVLHCNRQSDGPSTRGNRS